MEEELASLSGEVIWRHGDIESRRTFVRNFSKTITETASTLLKLARVHVNRAYRVYRKDNRWVVGQSGQAKFWQLHHGLRLMNKDGHLFRLRSDGDADLLVDGMPCPKGLNECRLIRPSTKEVPPHRGWASFQVRFTHPLLPSESEVYVNGFRAFKNGQHYEYWAKGGISHSLMIMNGNVISHRSIIVPSKLQTLEITMPTRIARR